MISKFAFKKGCQIIDHSMTKNLVPNIPRLNLISCYYNYRYEQFLEHSKTTHAMGRVGCTDEVGKKTCNQILIPIMLGRMIISS